MAKFIKNLLIRASCIKSRRITVLSLLLLTSCSDVFSLSIYVSPKGSDSNSGTAKAPFATLDAARRYVSMLRKKKMISEPIEIIVTEGTYSLKNPLIFTAEDSGSEKSPLIIRGKEGAVPVFIGAVKLPHFQLVSDKLWKVNVPDISKYGRAIQQLFVNGQRAIRARTPNEDVYFRIKDVSESRLTTTIGHEKDKLAVQTIKLAKEQMDVLPVDKKELQHTIISINHAWDRTRKYVRDVSVKDTALSISGRPMQPWNKLNNSAQFYFENAKGFLDAPGEFFVDPRGSLFYVPRKGELIENSMAVVPVIEQLLVIRGTEQKKVKNIHFKNISFQFTNHVMSNAGEEPSQAAAPTEAAIMVDYADDIYFDHIEVSHTGNNALWFRAGCNAGNVTNCYFHDLGIGGVKIGEMNIPDTEERATSNIVVDNNIFRSGSKEVPTGVGVMIFQSGDNTISHNEIADFGYTGISVGWVWGYASSPAKRNKILFNHIHHLGWGLLSDMGGVYTLGLSEGTIVSNNVIHDIYSFGYGGWGLYTDEGSTGILMENNLVYNCKNSGFHQHYGQNNVIRNNIFAFQTIAQLQATRVEDHQSFKFINNIVYFNNGKLPENNWFKVNAIKENNIYWDTRSSEVDTGNDKNALVADPLFVDALKYDFHFKNNSVISKINFKPFDYSKAGVYGSASWKKLALFAPELTTKFALIVKQRLAEQEPN